MRWVLLFALAWLTVLGLFTAAVEWPAPPLHVNAASAVRSDLVRALNSVEPHDARHPPTWIVTHAASAQRLMVVDIEADRPDEARRIAREIVEALEARYEEVLIYVRPPGAPKGAPARRIQWTARGGFLEGLF